MGSFSSSSSLSSSSRGLKAYLTETHSVTLTLRRLKRRNPPPTTPPHLWLLADGRHRNMMTSRMVENRKRQKASSIHSSLQSCVRVQTNGENTIHQTEQNQHLRPPKDRFSRSNSLLQSPQSLFKSLLLFVKTDQQFRNK